MSDAADLDSLPRLRRASGWRRTARPPCALPVTDAAETPWGGRELRLEEPGLQALARPHGRRRAGPPLPGPRNTAAAASPRREARVLDQELTPHPRPHTPGQLRPVDARPGAAGEWRQRGTEEGAFLPRIVRGEVRWCQGYSEPGAGSDLASLQTKCGGQGRPLPGERPEDLDLLRRQGRLDLLPRAHRHRRNKHEGISFLLFDMTTPGVEPRPIQLISPARAPSARHSSPTCRSPRAATRGQAQRTAGTIAKMLLQHERQNISASGFGAGAGPGTGGGGQEPMARSTEDGKPLRRRPACPASPPTRCTATGLRLDGEAHRSGVEGGLGHRPRRFDPQIRRRHHEHRASQELMVEALGSQGPRLGGRGL